MINQFNPLKVLAYKEKIEGILKGGLPYPVLVEIDPSNYCNHKCVHCFFEGFRNREKMLFDKNKMFRIIRELISCGTESITFTGGGEPLINPATIEALQEFHKKIDFALVTNGALLDKKKCGVIAKTCKYIRISLDAATSETHYKLHGTNDFEAIVRNIDYLTKVKSKQLIIGIAYLLFDSNCNEIMDFTILMKKLGVDYLYFRPVLYTHKITKFNKMRKKLDQAKKLEEEDFQVFINYPRLAKLETNERRFDKCLSTPLITVIGVDGNVYLCCQFRGQTRWAIGNVFEKPLVQVWNSKRHKELIKKINIERCPPCRNANYNEIIEKCFIKDKIHMKFL